MAARFIDDYLSYLLARASYQVSREFHAKLKPYGLSVMEWRVLASLEGDGLTLSELADAVLFKQPTVSKLVDRMVRAGWVRRAKVESDRRKTRIRHTARGSAVVRELLAKAKAHESACLSGHKAAEIDALKTILRELIARNIRPRDRDKTRG
jgi:DNA-binding MarR family transcriptional regulator